MRVDGWEMHWTTGSFILGGRRSQFSLCGSASSRQSQIFILLKSIKSGNLELLMWLFPSHSCLRTQNKSNISCRGEVGEEKESSIPTPLPLRCSPKIQVPVWPAMKLIALREECGNNGLRTLWMNYALQARGSSAHRCPKLYFYMAHI